MTAETTDWAVCWKLLGAVQSLVASLEHNVNVSQKPKDDNRCCARHHIGPGSPRKAVIGVFDS